MPGRKKRIPNTYNIDLPLPVSVAGHSAGMQQLLAALIKYLAFAREQCHAPFTDLQGHVQACQQQQQQKKHTGRPARLKTSVRKVIKYHDCVSAMLQLAANIPVAQLQGMPVAVLLGSSVLRPREVYCFTFPAGMDQPGVVPPSVKQVSDATRRLLRGLVMEHQNIIEWDSAPGPTKMFLLFQAKEGSLAAPPAGFTAKRAFHINLRKAFQVNIAMSSSAPGYQAVPAAGDDGEMQQLSQRMSMQMNISDADARDLPAPPVWYQCVVHAKGLKPQSG